MVMSSMGAKILTGPGLQKKVLSLNNEVYFGHRLVKESHLYHEFAIPAAEKYGTTVSFAVIPLTMLILSPK